MDSVAIDTSPVSLDALLRVARGAPVELTSSAQDRIAAGRRVVDGVLTSGRAVYGLTTGVGHSRDVRVPDDQLVGQQYMIVMTHSGGFGPHLPTELSRAAMAERLSSVGRCGPKPPEWVMTIRYCCATRWSSGTRTSREWPTPVVRP